MKRKIIFLGVILILLFTLIINCKEEVKKMPPLGKDNITGDVLWKRITEEQDYTKYPFFPEHKGMQPGQAPHGRFHKVFVNPTLVEKFPIEEKIAPNGSIIVKENCNSDQVLMTITVMAKINGYNPEHNDWFWAKYGVDGEIQAEGKVDPCIQCHTANKDNDYIIIQELDG